MREPSSVLPGDPWVLRAKQFRDGVKSLVGELETANLQSVIDPLRRVKSPAEIARMREAGRIGAEGIADAIRATRPGILERELEGTFELACLRNGAHGSAWTTIVATGPKITEFHYFENSRRIQPGEMILIDAGPDYNYYCSDLTRVWPADGPYPPRYRELYDKLLEVHKAMVAAVKPGVTYNDLNKVLHDTAKLQDIDKFIIGGAGHYTGMAPHDVGNMREPFVPGVVFNIEPLLVVGPENLHIRFEDTVLCTETGQEVFTPLDVLPWEADKLLEMRDGKQKR
jgi:Xaa-Pro aminopeptidase